ncbi:hypothetical protein FRB97_003892 [Tulasnella sp. 331]|nr:hypothetical protein FRB97_003892 [Tulasnella sp. 331]KAG8877407.1 hypothetical protein FRB98_006700 [Tulasnella sp. 332]
MAHPIQSLPSFAHTFSDIPRHASTSRSPLPPTPSRQPSVGTKRRHHETLDSPSTHQQQQQQHLHQPTSATRPARTSKRVSTSAPQIPTPSPHPRSPSDADADAEEDDEMEDEADVVVKQEEPDEIEPTPAPPAPTPTTSTSHPSIQDSKTYTYPTDNLGDSPSSRKKRRVTISGSNPLTNANGNGPSGIPLKLNTSARVLAAGGHGGGPASAFPGTGTGTGGSGPLTPGVSPVVIGFNVPRTPSGVPQRVSVDQVRSALSVKQQQKALIEARRHNPNAAPTPIASIPPHPLPTPPSTGSANGAHSHHVNINLPAPPSATVSAPSHSTIQPDHPRDALPLPLQTSGNTHAQRSRNRAVTVIGSGVNVKGRDATDFDGRSPIGERGPSVLRPPPFREGSSYTREREDGPTSRTTTPAKSSNLAPPPNSNPTLKHSSSDPNIPTSPSPIPPPNGQSSSLLARRKGPVAGSSLGVNTSGISSSDGLTTGERDAMDDSASGPQGWTPSSQGPVGGFGGAPRPRRQSSGRTPVLTVRTSGINPQLQHVSGTQSAVQLRDTGRMLVVERDGFQRSTSIPSGGQGQAQVDGGQQRTTSDNHRPQERQQRQQPRTQQALEGQQQHRNADNAPPAGDQTTETTASTLIPRNPMLALDPLIRSAPLTVGGKMIVPGSGRPSVGPSSPAGGEQTVPPTQVSGHQKQPSMSSSRPVNPFINAQRGGGQQQQQVPISTTLRTPHASHFSIPARNPYATQQPPPQQQTVAGPSGLGGASGGAAAGGATDKQSFLNLFGQFYDSLNDAKHLKTWLEGQIASSDKLLSTLERATRDLEIERARLRNGDQHAGAGDGLIVQQLRTRVTELEMRLARMEDRQHDGQTHHRLSRTQTQRDSAMYMDVDSGSGGEMPPRPPQHTHARSGSGSHHGHQQQHRRIPSRTIYDVEMHEGGSSAASSPAYSRRAFDSRHPPGPIQQQQQQQQQQHNGHGHLNTSFQFGGGAPSPHHLPMDPPVPARSRAGSNAINPQQQRPAIPLPPIASFANGTDDRTSGTSSSRREVPPQYNMGRRDSITGHAQPPQQQHLSPNLPYSSAAHSASRSPPQLPPINGGVGSSRSPQPHVVVSRGSPALRRGASPRVLSRGSMTRDHAPVLQGSSPPPLPPGHYHARRASRDMGVAGTREQPPSHPQQQQQANHRGIQEVSKAPSSSKSSASPPEGQRLVAVGGRAPNR